MRKTQNQNAQNGLLGSWQSRLGLCLLPFALCLLIYSAPMAATLSSQAEAPAEPAYLTPGELKLAADGKKLFVDANLIEADASNNSVIDKERVQKDISKSYHRLEERLDDLEDPRRPQPTADSSLPPILMLP